MTNTPFFSIVIPTYGMKGYGEKFLDYNLNILSQQTFTNFNVIISDHSTNIKIKKVCDKWGGKLKIRYFRNKNKIGLSSPNLNNAMINSNGEWIKILFQDDFLSSIYSLSVLEQEIKRNDDKYWFATACEHTNDGENRYDKFYPKWSNNMQLGNNTISSPSVITIKNTEDKLFFDEDLIWFMDIDYYKKMFNKYGEPHCFNNINVVNRIWGDSLSKTLSNELKDYEAELMIKRYGYK